MTKKELVEHLKADLVNEYTHLMFYLNAAGTVAGEHRAEFKEYFEKQAASEMEHVRQFTDLIIGLGGDPEVRHHPVPSFFALRDILKHAIALEEQVVVNFLNRIEQADKLGGIDGYYVKLFMEDQLQDSRKDIDEFKLTVSN